MQTIDFFAPQWYSESTNASLFYIYDRGAMGDMAHLSHNSDVAAISITVKNPSRKFVWFEPLDHNRDIRKDGSSDLESTCDFMLTVDDKEMLSFGEIKNRGKSWISGAIGQLETTVNIFKHNHDINLWRDKRAYVCNYKHPFTPQCYISRQERFRDESGVRLFVKNEIRIDSENQDCSPR